MDMGAGSKKGKTWATGTSVMQNYLEKIAGNTIKVRFREKLIHARVTN
jgi:hypothetical protein